MVESIGSDELIFTIATPFFLPIFFYPYIVFTGWVAVLALLLFVLAMVGGFLL